MGDVRYLRHPFYKEFRADGWPYCPNCENDELWSSTIPAKVETIAGCYFCRWKPPAAPHKGDDRG